MLKRRLESAGENRYRALLASGETTFFEIRDNNARVSSGQTFTSYPWGVDWEGVSMEAFQRKEEALCFLIRFSYGLANYHLIPSEILADFNLAYKSGRWVDGWGYNEPLLRNEVVFQAGGVKKPENRKIRYQEWRRGSINDFPEREKKKNRLLRVMESFRRRKAQKPQIRQERPDEECVFTLKSGSEAVKAYDELKSKDFGLRK